MKKSDTARFCCTFFVIASGAGLKAHVDSRLATPGETTSGTSHEKLMTPRRTREAIDAQVPSFINTLRNTLLGGVSSSYNTLRKLYNYITNSFYNRSQSDARYDRRTDPSRALVSPTASTQPALREAASRLFGYLTSAPRRLPQLSSTKRKYPSSQRRN